MSPATDALIAAAFAGAALITARKAAALLGIDEKQLRGLVASGKIGWTPISDTGRRFAEHHIRVYVNGLQGGEACQSGSRMGAASFNTNSDTKVVPFSARQGKRQRARP